MSGERSRDRRPDGRRLDGSRRVVITGLGIISPIGHSLHAVSTALQNDQHGIVIVDAWDQVDAMVTRLGAPVTHVARGDWPRKKVRSMGRVALLATKSAEAAVADSGLPRERISHPRTGLAFGSTHGSSAALEKFARTLNDPDALLGLGSNTYLKFMSHTCAVNLALFFEIHGRVLSTCSACVSGSQAIGAGYEAIRYGMQDVMLCGGAEELHWVSTGVFDVLQATSIAFNQDPGASPRPFDARRDGLVVGEGAATLVLESWESAQARGATVHAEVVGYGTTCDGTHITAPSPLGMQASMELALKDAAVNADALDYINAHATATVVGDKSESEATWRVVADRCPISSTKGFTGHTLGACGAIETVFAIAMMQDQFLAPNRNLETVGEDCAPLAYVRQTRQASPRLVLNNNFAFGGINTSLLLKRS